MKNKKIFTYIIALLLLIGVNACTNNNSSDNSTNKENETKLSETKEKTTKEESADANNLNNAEKENDINNNYYNDSSEQTYVAPEKEPVNIVSNGVTKKGYKIETINGITYVDGYLIANKTYSLPDWYEPENTHEALNGRDWCANCIDEEAYQAYDKMRNDLKNEGMNIYIASGYRGYYQQQGLYQMYVNQDGQEEADTYSARPGHSEHQTGFAFDICDSSNDDYYHCINDAYKDMPSAKWLKDNCYKYGFILRYPEGKTNETGYMYESWHFRYVGKELAEKLYNNGDWITMENYFGITSIYQD